MAVLVPRDFEFRSVPHSERRVLTALTERLPLDWLVVPSLRVRDHGTDREIDALVVAPDRGVLVVEVKGGSVDVDGDRWTSYGKPIKNPVDQVEKAKYALLGFLRASKVGTSMFFVDHAIALPDVICPTEGLGPRIPRELVIDRLDLENPGRAIGRSLHLHEPVPAAQVIEFVRTLVPTVSLDADDGEYYERAAANMDTATGERLGIARSMDANRRVLVEGGAGTGKTALVRSWARRATERGERTAVVCFNRLMADELADRLGDTEATVDSYHGLVVRLLEPSGFVVPHDPPPQWWESEPTAELVRRGAPIGTPFDTIVVDEAQDLRPPWLASLRGLLDPAGPHRLLMVMDPTQAIHISRWADPDEFFRASLGVNVRNSRAIARLCERLGGPPALSDNPIGPSPVFRRATGARELRKHVERTIDSLTDDEHVHPSDIAVLTAHTRTRDLLIEGVDGPDGVRRLTRWENRGPDTVLCETIHRAKGLEWTAVVVATRDDPIDDQLLYVGASRARMHLTLVGPDSLADALTTR